MAHWKNVFKIASVYIGVIIGAGFASGQEIMAFFTVYGTKWVWGMALAGVLFALAGWAVLDLVYRKKIKSYSEFMSITMGHNLGKIMEWVSGAFLCVLFCTMGAASGAAVKEAFGLPYGLGVVGLLVVCSVVFSFGAKGVVAVNSVLAPILLLGGILLSLFAYVTQSLPTFSFDSAIWQFSKTWAFSAVVYVSYNMVTTVSVLLPLRSYLTHRYVAFFSGVSSGLAMGLLGGAIGAVLFLNQGSIAGLEIPMLAIMHRYGREIEGLYLLILLAAILTTAVGNGFGALEFLKSKLPKLSPVLPVLFPVVAALTSVFGFSSWVGRIYPLFGYLGLFQMAVILLSFRKS